MAAKMRVKSFKTSALLILIALWLGLMTTCTLVPQFRVKRSLPHREQSEHEQYRTGERKEAVNPVGSIASTARNTSISNEVFAEKFVPPYYDEEDSYVTLDDVYISVKTGGIFHKTRIQLMLRTWFSTAKKQTFIFTDEADEDLNNATGGHLVNTPCESTHSRRHLSCKLGFEYDYYLRSAKKWWCHFDDDNYVNVRNLLSLLQKYTWKDDVYLGKSSTGRVFEATYKKEDVRFWFATGGAGFCVSRALAVKMARWSRNGKFLTTSDQLRLPDDCTIGFIINNRLGVDLIRIDDFHSHLEQLSMIPPRDLTKQISLSYHIQNGINVNKMRIPKQSLLYSDNEDPSRILSLHCLIYPDTSWCKDVSKGTAT